MEVRSNEKEKNHFRIDSRSRKDLLRRIEQLSLSYTPEWKFDEKNPDAGSVIAMIYANQTFESIGKLNRLLGKYRTEFANMYGVSLKAAKPASSVVVLSLNENRKSGIPLKKGTQVLGENEDGEEIIYEFLHDIYVTNARLVSILAVSEERNAILPYRGEFQEISLADVTACRMIPKEQETTGSFALFDFKNPRSTAQALLMYHRHLFDTESREITLRFTGDKDSSALAELFSNQEKYEFLYLSEEGLVPFERMQKQGDTVVLWHEHEICRQERKGQDMAAVILRARAAAAEDIHLDGIEIVTGKYEECPDFVINNRTELNASSFAPFDEQISLYKECYFGQKHLLTQAGAELTMSFTLSFEDFQMASSKSQEQNLSIIKRKPRAEYGQPQFDCWIQEISLEYFNGKGWKRLSCNIDVTALFAKRENAGNHKLTFTVPHDWESVTQGGYEQNMLRMQVVRADYCYMQGAEYHYPVISDMKMSIRYRQEGMKPEHLFRVKGAEAVELTPYLASGEMFGAFSKSVYSGDAVYFGFDRRLGQGPISLFLEFEKRLSFQGVSLAFSYSSRNGFKPLKVLDNTQNLQNSGTILFLPPSDMAQMTIEGVSNYWIRMEDTTKYFSKESSCCPVLKNLYINAVDVENLEWLEEQDYYIDMVTANMEFPLYAENILSAEVWVNEKDSLSSSELEALLQSDTVKTRAEYNFLGEIEEFYVLWQETDSFDMAGGQKRCYCIDRRTNRIIFGDGVNTAIPQNTRTTAFKARVLKCSGRKGNVKAHTIEQFRGNIFSIDEMTNPIDSFGGSPMEEVKDALERGSNILGSRKRLVSVTDYEREALLFSDTIDKVSCVAGSCRDGRELPSAVSLVLLMKDYKKGSYSFKNISRELKEHLIGCCEMTCGEEDLQIVEPLFVNISVTLWLVSSDIGRSIEIKQQWLERMERFIEPLGASGWEIGRLPKEGQIRLMLNTLEKEAQISKYDVHASYTDENGFHEVSLDKLGSCPFMVCCNGEHQIYMTEA